MSINLYIVRHGESVHNSYLRRKKEAEKAGLEFAEKIAVLDVPLTEKGIEEAVKAAEAIKEYKIDKIYSSPFVRTKETAEHMLKVLDNNISIEENPLLREYSRGNLNLLDPEEINALLGHDVQDREHKLLYDYTEHGGESHTDVKKRAAQFLKIVIDNPESDVLVVTSAGFIKSMYQVLFNDMLPGIHFNIYAKNGSIHHMKLDREFVEERIKDYLQ
ncbi:MAG: histidine phosphatase family protein [Patescibacteria group bacterium]